MPAFLNAATSAARRLTALRRRFSRLRHALPMWLVWLLVRSNAAVSRHVWPRLIRVQHRSRFANVFHCCVHKTGSQWIKSVLTDPMTYRYCGLTHHHYQSRLGGDARPVDQRTFPEPFPTGTLISPLYVSYDNYRAMPKLGPHRAFFVMRDPRDMLVSWYYSTRTTHLVSRDARSPSYQARRALRALDHRRGLLYAIDYLEREGRFAALRSWADAPRSDDVLVVRYEDLISADSVEAFRGLFDFLDIQIPDPVLAELVEAYSFRRLAGRERGQEDRDSHLRKAMAGDWKNHLRGDVYSRFREVTRDLPTHLGYESSGA